MGGGDGKGLFPLLWRRSRRTRSHRLGERERGGGGDWGRVLSADLKAFEADSKPSFGRGALGRKMYPGGDSSRLTPVGDVLRQTPGGEGIGNLLIPRRFRAGGIYRYAGEIQAVSSYGRTLGRRQAFPFMGSGGNGKRGAWLRRDDEPRPRGPLASSQLHAHFGEVIVTTAGFRPCVWHSFPPHSSTTDQCATSATPSTTASHGEYTLNPKKRQHARDPLTPVSALLHPSRSVPT